MLSALPKTRNVQPFQSEITVKDTVRRYLVHMPGCGGELVARCLTEMRGVCAEKVMAGNAMQLAALASAQTRTNDVQELNTVLRMMIPWQLGEEKARWAVWSEMELGRYRLAVVRHPMQAWLGMKARDPELSDERMVEYFGTFADFARRVSVQGFVTYEGLCRHPIMMLRTMCELLNVPYDPAFGKTYLENEQLSSIFDSENTTALHLNHREPTEEQIELAWCVPGFRESLDYLGYQDVSS